MADDSNGKASIPAWQQRNSSASDSSKSDTPAPSQSQSQSQSSDDSSAATTPQSTLVEQATKFLHDESIRDASKEQKITFLESKGLQRNDIESLLGASQRADESGDVSATETNNTSEDKERSETSSNASPKVTPSSSSSSSSSTAPSSTPAAQPSPAPSQPRDMPPIITYPEFLTKQSKPPPLVTLNSILYTIYGAMGLGASIYGASEYLVKPMLANLTSARHEFAQTTQENLHKLNEKLEQTVSVIPPSLAAGQQPNQGADTDDNDNEDDEDDADSVTSDPTELFHRDVATQTTPQDLAKKEEEEGTGGEGEEQQKKPTPTETVASHLKRMETITSHLREFADAETESNTADETVRGTLRDLHYYLDGLTYSNPSYGSVSSYGTWSSPSVDSSSSLKTGVDKSEEEAMASFRSEIRGVKGALLSARNFPAGRGARIGSSFAR